LLSLHESDLLEILPLAGRIYIPTAVEAELRTLDPIPEWLETVALDAHFEHEALTWVRSGILDPGESAAIALFRQLEAGWLLTDDAAARLVAQREGIEVHGSLGLAGAGVVGRCRRTFRSCQRSGCSGCAFQIVAVDFSTGLGRSESGFARALLRMRSGAPRC